MPNGKRDRGNIEVEMSNLSSKSELTLNTEKAQAIFCEGLDKLNRYIAQANDSDDEYTRHKQSHELGRHLFQHASACRYFDLGTFNGDFRISLASKKFLLPCDIALARSHFYSLRGLVIRFIEKRQSAVGLEAKDSIEESKEEVTERARLGSDISIEAALTEAGLYESEIIPQPKLPPNPDLIDPIPRALPKLLGKTIIFDSKWHLRRSISPWYLPFGGGKSKDVQYGLDHMHALLLVDQKNGSAGRGARFETVLNVFSAVSDRILTHRKPVRGKKYKNGFYRIITGSNVKNTRSGEVFIKCLTRHCNQFFLHLILHDFMRMHQIVVQEGEKGRSNLDAKNEFISTHITLSNDNVTLSNHILTKGASIATDANFITGLLRIIRVWVMCRYAKNHAPEQDTYAELSLQFFNGVLEDKRCKELKRDDKVDDMIKDLETQKEEARQSYRQCVSN